jgi:hypothetical protein
LGLCLSREMRGTGMFHRGFGFGFRIFQEMTTTSDYSR